MQSKIFFHPWNVIQFTVEIEQNDQIPFFKHLIDVLLRHNLETISTGFSCKAINTYIDR